MSLQYVFQEMWSIDPTFTKIYAGHQYLWKFSFICWIWELSSFRERNSANTARFAFHWWCPIRRKKFFHQHYWNADKTGFFAKHRHQDFLQEKTVTITGRLSCHRAYKQVNQQALTEIGSYRLGHVRFFFSNLNCYTCHVIKICNKLTTDSALHSCQLKPVSWNRYEPYLWENEKQSYKRYVVLFGFLVQLNHMYTGTVQKLPTKSNADSNIMRCSQVPRFKYLPIR